MRPVIEIDHANGLSPPLAARMTVTSRNAKSATQSARKAILTILDSGRPYSCWCMSDSRITKRISLDAARTLTELAPTAFPASNAGARYPLSAETASTERVQAPNICSNPTMMIS